MKRIISVFLTLCILITLASCGGKTAEEQAVPSEQEQTTAIFENKVRAGGYYKPFLPDGFPESLPTGMDVHSTVYYPAAPAETGYTGELIRLRIMSSEEGISLFNYSLSGGGWTGGCGVFEAEEDSFGETDSPWVYGVWRNAEKTAVISDSVYIGENTDKPFSLTLDILNGRKGLPKALTDSFPYFNGYSVSGGTVTCLDENGKELSSELCTDAPYWRWDFLTPDVFSGVTETAAENYLDAFESTGFAVSTEERTDSRGTVIISTAVKEVGSTEYYAEVMYFRYLKAMMISFTNSFDRFKNEERQKISSNA